VESTDGLSGGCLTEGFSPTCEVQASDVTVTRDTSTGTDYEEIVERCLQRQCGQLGLELRYQVFVGEKPTGGQHRIDWELVDESDANRRGLVSCKVQNVAGTAEEKVIFEVIKLLHALDQDSRYKRAWLVLGGTGWSPGMKRFLMGDLKTWLPSMDARVVIVADTDSLLNVNLSLSES
jgi:hypothetical protein